ncbi:FAD-dependent monooxygenase (plasmid) [Streptomyces sp. NBC_00028]|uniref:FAD-dependent monooxygenase n=1 Tax=Streptomyces sp. NBC_00028 TaxID=2975624 RepID=UPI002F9107ED
MSEVDNGDAARGLTGPWGPVLVVGAGPVGLVAGIELARRGVDVRLVDREAAPRAGSRGKGLQPRSVEVFDDLGVAGRVLATSRSRLAIRKYRGRSVLGTSDVVPGVPEPTPSTPYPRTVLLPQWRVEEILRERLADLGVTVEYGTELADLTQHSDRVRVLLKSASGSEHGRFSHVVGCDGASSTVRTLLGIEFLGQTDETVRMLTADVEVSGLDRDFWHWWPSADGRLLALCPMAATDTFQLQVGVGPDTAGELQVEQIQALVEERSGRSDLRIRRVAWQSIWRFNVRMVNRYRAGRAFLAGDAAHVHAPAGGLGMNTGIQDAYNLGWKLAHVLRGAPEALLDTYEQERLPVAADVLNLSCELIAQRVRGVVPGGARGRDTLQLKVCYPGSELNGSPRTQQASEHPHVQAGDRAPDSVVYQADGTAVRLFDLFRGPHSTVLAFGSRSAKCADALARRFPDHLAVAALLPRAAPDAAPGTAFIDREGSAHQDYGIDGDTLLVIRPDGYVALRTTAPNETDILDHLRRFLPDGGSTRYAPEPEERFLQAK